MKSTYKSLFEIIEESVERGRGGWDLDPAHPRRGRSYEKRFRTGDKQIVLWEISRCIKNKKAIPEWAGIAFRVALERVVTCESTWDQAFGKVPAGGRYRKSIQTAAKSVKVCERIEELHRAGRPIDKDLFNQAGKELRVGTIGRATTVQNIWKKRRHFQRDKIRADISS
jgi:hypothetical protein